MLCAARSLLVGPPAVRCAFAAELDSLGAAGADVVLRAAGVRFAAVSQHSLAPSPTARLSTAAGAARDAVAASFAARAITAPVRPAR